MTTEHGRPWALTNARIFDGTDVLESGWIVVHGSTITAVGNGAPPGDLPSTDVSGSTVLPGLIDAHMHVQPPSLQIALSCGVTTAMDMFSYPEWMQGQRADAAARNDLADVRSASIGATVAGGHPSMMIGTVFPGPFPTIADASDVAPFVDARIAEGADYIKLLIDDGAAFGHASPTLSEELATRVVEEAHGRGLLALAHATTLEGTRQAVRAGADGLMHAFNDVPPTAQVVEEVARSGAFVVPTLVTIGAMTDEYTGAALAEEQLVRDRLPEAWRGNLCGQWHMNSPSSFANARRAVTMLREAGVDLLVGTDAAAVGVFATAPGASLHDELRLLVDIGMTPVEALRAATSTTARRFGLADRGRVAAGLQADLVLVGGDPTTDIAATLDLRSVWRRGERFDVDAYRARVLDAVAG